MTDEEQIVSFYTEDNMNINAIARKMRLSPTKVSATLIRNGIEIKYAPGVAQTFDVEQIKSDYEAGRSVRQIAKDLGVDHSTVSRVLRNMGYDTNSFTASRCPLSQEQLDEMIKLYKDGLTNYAELGRRFNISKHTARKYILNPPNLNRKPEESKEYKFLVSEEAILEKYAELEGYTPTAKALGCSIERVVRVVAKSGVKPKKISDDKAKIEFLEEDILSVYKSTRSLIETASLLDINVGSVKSTLEKKTTLRSAHEIKRKFTVRGM